MRVKTSLLKIINDEVDGMLEASLLEGTPQIAIDFGYNLVETGHIRGVQLARLLYLLDDAWDSFETDERFVDAVFGGMGIPLRKGEDYVNVYKYVLIPHPELSGHPMAGLIDIVPSARDQDFTEEDWEELAMAHDKQSMIAIRQRVRGLMTSGTSRVGIDWDPDGYVRAYKEGEEPETLGNLKRKADTDHGQVALDRLMDKRVTKR